MKLASYIFREKQAVHPTSIYTAPTVNERRPVGQLAWVETDSSLVDAASVYRWSCKKTGMIVDPQVTATLMRLGTFIEDWQRPERFSWLQELREQWLRGVENGDEHALRCRLKQTDVRVTLPFEPVSFRDFYAFEQHVKTARSRRGLEMVPEWYQFPVFYFSNPHSFRGPDEPVWAPYNSVELDFELEVACVIKQPGESISARKADLHIAGFLLLNDWSARDLQRLEMRVGLGPAKGKDFATSLGPYFVTPDELSTIQSAQGLRQDVPLQAAVNGKVVSTGNLRDLHYTFAQMIERASRDVPLSAGEVMGSGTVGTGCILELGTEVQPWLVPGDSVKMTGGQLGVLQTPIVSRPQHECS